jgi:hypothetical protein
MSIQPFESNLIRIFNRLFLCYFNLFLVKCWVSPYPCNNRVYDRNNIFNAGNRRRFVIIIETFIKILIDKARIFISPNRIIEKVNYFDNKSFKSWFILRVNMVMMNHIGTCGRSESGLDIRKLTAIPFKFFDRMSSPRRGSVYFILGTLSLSKNYCCFSPANMIN